MIERFQVRLYDEAFEFTQNSLKNALTKFGSLEHCILEFNIDFLPFEKEDKSEGLVFAIRRMIKKTSKVNKKEMRKADKIRIDYLNNKNKKK